LSLLNISADDCCGALRLIEAMTWIFLDFAAD
jgi:hypothetical protein